MRTKFLSLCVLGFISFANNSIAEKKTLTVVSDVWCPYICHSGSLREGIYVEAVREVFAKHDIELEYVELPWTRALNQLTEGAVDAVIGASEVDAPDALFPKTPLGRMRNTFFTKINSTWAYHTLDDLRKIRLGVIKDYSYSADIVSYIASQHDSLNIYISSGEKALSKLAGMLFDKSIDVVLEDKLVFDYFTHQDKRYDDAFKAAGEVPSFKVSLAFSPKRANSKDYVKIIDDNLSAFYQTPEWSNILKKYGLENSWSE